MKVLHVLPSLDPEFGGAPEADVKSCIAAQRSGIDTAALIAVDKSTIERATLSLDILRSNGISVRVLETALGAFGRRNAVVQGLSKLVNSIGDDFDLIHLHSPWVMTSVLTALSWQSVPLLMTPHEGFTYLDVCRS